MFISGRETSEAFVNQIRSDLATAQRLAPNDPIVLAVSGYFQMCANDTSGALEAYAAAEVAGLTEPEYLLPKEHLLLRRSRIEELNATVRRTLALDPADPVVINLAIITSIATAARGRTADRRVRADRLPGLYRLASIHPAGIRRANRGAARCARA